MPNAIAIQQLARQAVRFVQRKQCGLAGERVKQRSFDPETLCHIASQQAAD
jgi:hypothetical protein